MWKVLLLTCFVGICSVVSCPHHCQCFLEEGLRTANCSGSALTSHQQPSQVDVLNVRPHYNAFRTKLTPRGFKNFKNIKFLNLSNTSVTNIPDEVFHGLNYIIAIDLSYNKIKHLNGGVFKELATLQTLSLRGNPLMLAQSDVIVSKSLRKLDMGNCGLRNIPAGTFAHVVSLTALFLDGNSIQTVGYHSVPLGLWYLNLANNHIVNVPTDVLHVMKSLTRIDMSGNPIKCTCHLLLLQDTFSGQGRAFENDIVCAGPRQFYGQKLSEINENDLCNLEFMKKERFMNSIKHYRDVRSYRKHNMIKSPYDDNFGIQGDQPHMSDDLTPNHDIEIMFQNDDTRSMGTHMQNTFSTHHHGIDDISDENNKLSVSKPNHIRTDLSSTEADIVSSEQDDAPEDLKMPDEESDIDRTTDVVNNSSKTETEEVIKDNESIEDLNEGETSPLISSTEKTELKSENNLDENKSTDSVFIDNSKAEEIIGSSLIKNHTDQAEEFSPHSNEELYEETETTVIHDTAELSDSRSVLNDTKTSDDTDSNDGISSEHEETTDSVSILDDVESISSDVHNFTHEAVAKYSHAPDQDNITHEFDDASIASVDDIFNGTSLHSTNRPDSVESYTWPTSKSDITDYNYDTQHDDYASVDPSKFPNTTSEISNLPLTTEVYSSQEKLSTDFNTTASSFSIEPDEGSGEILNETSSEEEKGTVLWLDEQENESTTIDYSVDNVSELFNITSEDFPLSHYTFDNVSSSIESEDITTAPTEQSSSSSTDEKSEEGIFTTEETTLGNTSSEENVTTIFFIPEEKTTEATSLLEEENTESTSSSSTASYISSTPSPSIEVSSESEKSTSEETTTETSTESSTIPVLIPDIEEEEEDKKKEEITSTSTSATSEPPVVSVSSGIPEVSDVSSTPVAEIEILRKTVLPDDKENMILDPTKEEISKSDEDEESADLAMITFVAIIMILIIIIMIISLAVICRKKSRPKNKVRLPNDTEANIGTEMQDMLLPKPPENGVKVLPKNYTNGTTANGNKPEQKEEETPVLSAEPETIQEQDWEEKPEPIETVTARLSMLARPQTPVFIPKTLN